MSEVDFGVVVLDLRLPGKDGLEVLKEARAERPQLKGIVITAAPDALEKLIQNTLGPVQAEIKPV